MTSDSLRRCVALKEEVLDLYTKAGDKGVSIAEMGLGTAMAMLTQCDCLIHMSAQGDQKFALDTILTLDSLLVRLRIMVELENAAH